MNSIEALYRGKLNPAGKAFWRDSPYAEAMERMCETEDALHASLSSEAKAQLEVFARAQEEITEITAVEEFISGFRLGVKIMLDVFSGPQEQSLREITF